MAHSFPCTDFVPLPALRVLLFPIIQRGLIYLLVSCWDWRKWDKSLQEEVLLRSVPFILYMKILDLGYVKMSTLRKSQDVDLESVNSNHDGRDGDDGGGFGGSVGDPQVATTGEGGGPLSSEAHEDVRVSKSNGDNHKRKDERRESNVSESSVEIVDLESGAHDTKLCPPKKVERDCRICHLSMDANSQDCGVPIELGCSCKDELAAAHKQCAESWFKIKGNRTCEICGSIAQNVAGVSDSALMQQWNETNDADATIARASAPLSQSRNLWRGHRLLNFLLACMVFAFVISWLFHFNVHS